MGLFSLVERQKEVDKVAFIDNSTSITYRALYNKSLHNASLIESQFNQSLHVALLLPNSVDYVIWYFSIACSRSVIVPIYYNSSPFEILNILDTCDVHVLVTDRDMIEKLQAFEFPHIVKWICVNDYTVGTYGIYGRSTCLCRYPYASLLLGTSGSMSNPKRVILTDKNLMSNVTAICESLGYTQDEMFLIILPMAFASANTSQLLACVSLCATAFIYQDLIHPKSILNSISTKLITNTTVVPSIFRLLVNSEKPAQQQGFSSLRTICFGGGPSSSNTTKKAITCFQGVNLIHMYGQTEASARISHFSVSSFPSKVDSVGTAIGSIKLNIVDDDGRVINDNREGEIRVKGDNVADGYYIKGNRSLPLQTAGWLYTGDIGRIDEDGHLFVTGRKRNIIISAGINIYPEEIEGAILNSGFVEEVIAYAEPDENYGEIPIVDVVIKTGQITKEDIKIYCKSVLPNHKLPRRINIVQGIAKTSNGKTERRRANE